MKGNTSQSTLQGAEALTQTCPKAAPSGGPYQAKSWLALSPGEVRYQAGGAKSYLSAGGNPAVDAAVDPIGGGGSPCSDHPGRRPERRGHLAPPQGDRLGLHPARLAHGDRRPAVVRDLPARGRPPVGRRARRHPDPRRARHLPPGGLRPPGLPTASQRLEVRRRPSGQARAAGQGRALLAPLQRHVQRPGGERRLPPAGRRPARQGPGDHAGSELPAERCTTRGACPDLGAQAGVRGLARPSRPPGLPAHPPGPGVHRHRQPRRPAEPHDPPPLRLLRQARRQGRGGLHQPRPRRADRRHGDQPQRAAPVARRLARVGCAASCAASASWPGACGARRDRAPCSWCEGIECGR